MHILQQEHGALSSNQRWDQHGWPSILLPLFYGHGLPTIAGESEVPSDSIKIKRRFTKKSLVSTLGVLVKTPCAELSKLASSAPHLPTRAVISGADQRKQLRLIHQQFFCSCCRTGFQAVAAHLQCSSSTANDSTSVYRCDASVRPGVKGTFTS